MDGTEEQKAFWLPKFASGEITVLFALTEPETGLCHKHCFILFL